MLVGVKRSSMSKSDEEPHRRSSMSCSVKMAKTSGGTHLCNWLMKAENCFSTMAKHFLRIESLTNSLTLFFVSLMFSPPCLSGISRILPVSLSSGSVKTYQIARESFGTSCLSILGLLRSVLEVLLGFCKIQGLSLGHLSSSILTRSNGQ